VLVDLLLVVMKMDLSLLFNAMDPLECVGVLMLMVLRLTELVLDPELLVLIVHLLKNQFVSHKHSKQDQVDFLVRLFLLVKVMDHSHQFNAMDQLVNVGVLTQTVMSYKELVVLVQDPIAHHPLLNYLHANFKLAKDLVYSEFLFLNVKLMDHSHLLNAMVQQDIVGVLTQTVMSYKELVKDLETNHNVHLQ